MDSKHAVKFLGVTWDEGNVWLVCHGLGEVDHPFAVVFEKLPDELLRASEEIFWRYENREFSCATLVGKLDDHGARYALDVSMQFVHMTVITPSGAKMKYHWWGIPPFKRFCEQIKAGF